MPTIYKPPKRNQYAYKRTDYNSKESSDIYNDRRWRDLRSWYFQNHPLCEQCQKEGRITPAEHIHHIIPFLTGRTPEERRALAYDESNLMSLCKVCHQKFHKR